MKEEDIRNMNTFWLYIECNGYKARIYKNYETDTIDISIDDFFIGLEFCKIDEVEFLLEFEMKDIKRGNIVKIDEMDCKIIDFDLETNREFNEFCDYCEQVEYSYFESN